ncbi:MAG: hypothetical protein NZM25_10150 [Leptospiraceae bacterium]|nr:hypothetical protein [Leptospiraceae bacterium]MDW8307511.1 hypothetical protein [Leptospiraceae bacterium]
MKKFFLQASLLLFALLLASCSSKEETENLKVGEKRDIKDNEGQVIGQYEQISATEGVYRIDQNRDGAHEKSIHLKEGKIRSVDYDPDQNGIVDKSVVYENDEPVRVIMFSKKEQSVLGIGNVQKNRIVSVDLPGRNKRVYFAEDGSVSRIETLAAK